VSTKQAYYLDGTLYVIDASSNKIAVGTITNTVLTAVTVTTGTITTAVIGGGTATFAAGTITSATIPTLVGTIATYPTVIGSTIVSGATVFAQTALKVGTTGASGINAVTTLTNAGTLMSHRLFITNGVIVGVQASPP
jgi:hypothetical protein